MIMDLSALRLCVVWFFFLVFFPLCNRRLSAWSRRATVISAQKELLLLDVKLAFISHDCEKGSWRREKGFGCCSLVRQESALIVRSKAERGRRQIQSAAAAGGWVEQSDAAGRQVNKASRRADWPSSRRIYQHGDEDRSGVRRAAEDETAVLHLNCAQWCVHQPLRVVSLLLFFFFFLLGHFFYRSNRKFFAVILSTH